MNFREFFTTTSWWGKLLGALFGYLAGGSMTAILGILIGNFFDRGLINHFSNPYWLYFREKQNLTQKKFFKATFLTMGHLAKADGRVTEQELNMARLLMQELYLNKEQKEEAMRLFNEGKKPDFNLNELLVELYTICANKQGLLNLFMDIQYRAAKIDGLNTKKIQILDVIFSHLGFAPFHQQHRFYEDFGSFNESHAQPNSSSSRNSYQHKPSQTNLEQAYALLEVTTNMSKQEVKKAYRRLLSRNHPDKLIAAGLSEGKIKIANEKTQKIVKAYELICSSKGW